MAMKLKFNKTENKAQVGGEDNQPQYCKKIVYNNMLDGNRPTILLGIIIEETAAFIGFRTANKNYRINKTCITEISDTKTVFIAQPL